MAIEKKYMKRAKRWLWGFNERIAGRRKRVYEFETRAEAAEVLAHLKLNARADKYGLPRQHSPVPLTKLIAAKEADKPRTQHERQVVANLRKLAALFPALVLQELEAAHLKKLREQWAADGAQASSINQYLRLISSGLHSACDIFPPLKNWTPPKMPYIRGADKRRERIATPEEKVRILAALRNPPSNEGRRGHKWKTELFYVMADLFELALLTVRRQGELLLIRKSDVSLELSSLRTLDVKKKIYFHLPIGERAKEILRDRAQGKRASDYLFAPVDGPDKRYVDSLRRVLKWACNKAGVAYGHKVAGGLVFHDTRHTAMTNLLRAGHDLATAQSLSRQSSKTIALRYGHATEQSQRAALDALEEFGVQSATSTVGEEENFVDIVDTEGGVKRLAS